MAMEETGMKKFIRRSAWVLLVLSAVILFPCMLDTVYYFVSSIFRSEFVENIFYPVERIILYLFMLFILAGCFYLQYILPAVSAVLFIISAVNNKRTGDKPSKRKKILFIVCWVVCILGLVSSESLFRAAMGI